MTPLEKAIKCVGGVTALADSIGTQQSFVSQWKCSARPIPARWCIPIEDATGGEVTRYDLRPDVFGQPNEAA